MKKKPVIIYVDDEEIVLNSIKGQLRRNFDRTIRFESAQSAEEGLELLEELKIDDIVVPLVISDHIMPNMKGDEFLTKVYQNYPEVKTILLTGQADVDAVANTINDAHLFKYLSKPWKEEELVDLIKEAINEYNSSCELNKLYEKLYIQTDADDSLNTSSSGTIQLGGKTEMSIQLKIIESAIFKLIEAKEDAEVATDAKSQFLSTMTHELRTPLNAIIGLSNLLREQNPQREQLENIEALLLSSKTLKRLISDILDFSKIEAGYMELDINSINLNDLISGILQVHSEPAKSKGIDLRLSVEGDLPNVLVDEIRLIQILNNLLSNAIKFTLKGSVELKITTEKEDADNCTILFDIKDTGIGIQPENIKKVFTSFSQVGTGKSFGGTGLGLAITKRLVNLLKGTIEVKSVFGKGTSFLVTLPFKKCKKSTEELKKIESNQRTQFNNESILFVEDNSLNVLVGKQFLSQWGLETTVVNDGVEAVEATKKTDFKLILMDCNMPIMDGYQATLEIRKFNKDVPIIAVTASATVDDKTKILEAGMNGFIGKPYDPVALNNLIAKFLNYPKN